MQTDLIFQVIVFVSVDKTPDIYRDGEGRKYLLGSLWMREGRGCACAGLSCVFYFRERNGGRSIGQRAELQPQPPAPQQGIEVQPRMHPGWGSNQHLSVLGTLPNQQPGHAEQVPTGTRGRTRAVHAGTQTVCWVGVRWSLEERSPSLSLPGDGRVFRAAMQVRQQV